MPIISNIIGNCTNFIDTSNPATIYVLTHLLHAFVVLHSEKIINRSIWKFTLALCLMSSHGLFVFVLVCSMKVWVGPTELRVFIASEHLLYLLVIEFGQATQAIFLKSKRSRSFEVGDAVIFEGVLIIVNHVVWAEWLVLVGYQVMHLAGLVGLSIKSSLYLL